MTYQSKDKYLYVGVSYNQKNEISVRYTNNPDSPKLANLEPKLVLLPSPMNRKEALAYILNNETFSEKERVVISETLDRRNGKVVKKKKSLEHIPNSVFDLSRTVFLSKR